MKFLWILIFCMVCCFNVTLSSAMLIIGGNGYLDDKINNLEKKMKKEYGSIFLGVAFTDGHLIFTLIDRDIAKKSDEAAISESRNVFYFVEKNFENLNNETISIRFIDNPPDYSKEVIYIYIKSESSRYKLFNIKANVLLKNPSFLNLLDTLRASAESRRACKQEQDADLVITYRNYNSVFIDEPDVYDKNGIPRIFTEETMAEYIDNSEIERYSVVIIMGTMPQTLQKKQFKQKVNNIVNIFKERGFQKISVQLAKPSQRPIYYEWTKKRSRTGDKRGLPSSR